MCFTYIILMFILYWIGLDWIGLDWIGLDWIGLDWIGLDWIGLDWIGLDWIVLYCIVLYCIVLNCFTGTPLSPVDYFPGNPVIMYKYIHICTHIHKQCHIRSGDQFVISQSFCVYNYSASIIVYVIMYVFVCMYMHVCVVCAWLGRIHIRIN